MMSEVMLAVTAVLLVGTASAIVVYYQRIRALRQQYDAAKGVVNDIVMSVDNQFRRHATIVEYVAQQVEQTSIENQVVSKKVETCDSRLTDLAATIEKVPQFEEKFSEQINEVKTEVNGIKVAQEKMLQKLVEIEKIKREIRVPDFQIEAAIPIKKENALSPLTETEIMVLETIGIEGEKTAPEIREKISLTREHTARLMKKLYKDGYLERNTHKMPYVYSLKEEMKRLLKQKEVNVQ